VLTGDSLFVSLSLPAAIIRRVFGGVVILVSTAMAMKAVI
jgi:hypothetical protein